MSYSAGLVSEVEWAEHKLQSNFNQSPSHSFHKSLFLKPQLKTITHVLEPIYISRPLSTGTCIQQGDLFYSAGLHRNRCQPQLAQEKLWRGFGNSSEQTGRVGISKVPLGETESEQRTLIYMKSKLYLNLLFCFCFWNEQFIVSREIQFSALLSAVKILALRKLIISLSIKFCRMSISLSSEFDKTYIYITNVSNIFHLEQCQ